MDAIKKPLLIALAVIVALAGAYYVYHSQRLKAGYACFERFRTLERARDLKFLDMFDEKSKVYTEYLYPDKSRGVSDLNGIQFKQDYYKYITNEDTQGETENYIDVKIEKEEGNFIVSGMDYSESDNTQGPFKIVFDGDRMDACMVLESSLTINVNKMTSYNTLQGVATEDSNTPDAPSGTDVIAPDSDPHSPATPE